MQEKNAELLKIATIAFAIMMCFRVVIMTIFITGMYADGTDSFFHVINLKSLYLWYSPRNGAMLLWRIFTFLLIKAGVNDLSILAYAYSFGCVFWNAIYILFSLLICIKAKNRNMAWYTIIAWPLIFTFTGLYCQHESFLTAAIIWFVFCCVSNWKFTCDHIGLYIFLLITLLLSLIGTYESFGIIGILITAVFIYSTYRSFINKENREKIAIVFLLLAINTIIELYYVIKPQLKMANDALISSIIKQDKELYILLILIAGNFFFREFFHTCINEKIVVTIETAISIYAAIYMCTDINRVVTNTRILHGMFNIVVPATVVAYYFLYIFTKRTNEPSYLVISISLIICSTISSYSTSYGYYNYLKGLNDYSKQCTGFIAWSDEGSEDLYNTDWTVPFESILANVVIGHKSNIDSIIVQNPKNIYYQPFNMWNIDEYYDLSDYGIIYDKSCFYDQSAKE